MYINLFKFFVPDFETAKSATRVNDLSPGVVYEQENIMLKEINFIVILINYYVIIKIKYYLTVTIFMYIVHSLIKWILKERS